MMKAAIDFSDGVIQGSAEINPEVAEYIAESGKANLGFYPTETYMDAYSSFYDEILASKGSQQ